MADIAFKKIEGRRDRRLEKINIQQAESLLRRFGQDAIASLRQYPGQRPGAKYRRKGSLRESWNLIGPEHRGLDISVRGESQGTRYGVYVQGPTRGARKRQRSLFAERGWLSVSRIEDIIWPRYKARILQQLGGKGVFRAF